MIGVAAANIHCSVDVLIIAAMTCPDWQYPHCGTSSLAQVDWTTSATFPETDLTGAHRLTINVNGASAAQRLAASVLRPDKSQIIPQNPKQRLVGVTLISLAWPLSVMRIAHPSYT